MTAVVKQIVIAAADPPVALALPLVESGDERGHVLLPRAVRASGRRPPAEGETAAGRSRTETA